MGHPSNEQPRETFLALAWTLGLPYLLTAGFVLGVLGDDSLSTPPLFALLQTLGVACVVVAMLHLLVGLIVRRPAATALITCIWICYLGAFGYVQLRLQTAISPAMFLAAWTVSFAALAWLVWRGRENPRLASASSLMLYVLLTLLGLQAF